MNAPAQWVSAEPTPKMNRWLRCPSAWVSFPSTSACRLTLTSSTRGHSAVNLAAASGLGLGLLFWRRLAYSRRHRASDGGQAASDVVRNLSQCARRTSQVTRYSAQERLLPGNFPSFSHRVLQDFILRRPESASGQNEVPAGNRDFSVTTLRKN